MLHQIEYDVTFGDCDPAGIVFYPNIYSMLDRCFHDWLRRFGGHAALCEQLGLVGMGLREASSKFRRPVRDGDRISVSIDGLKWDEKTLGIDYVGRLGETVVFTGRELRALLVFTRAGIKAGDTGPLKTAIETYGERN